MIDNEFFDGFEEPTETAETSVESENTENAVESEGNQQPAESEQVGETANPQETPQRRQYTPEERASYSFRKQLNKQRNKYEGQYNQLQTQYNQLLDRLDRLEHPEKYQPLNRQQFQDDDSYIDAIVQQRFDNMWTQKLEEVQNRYNEQARANEEVTAYRNRANDNVKKLFKTPESEKQYRDAVNIALQNGLGELIDQDKETAKFIMRSDFGPKIVYELATKPELVEEMFADSVTDMDRQFKIRQLEDRIRAEMAPKPQVIGKPGIQQETTRGSIFDSDESVLNFLRTH